MSILFIVLFLLFVLNAFAQTLWKDKFDVNNDISKLERGENLVYVSSGSSQFSIDVVTSISHEFSISPENVHCFSLSHIKKSTFVFDVLSKQSSIRTLIIINELQIVEGDFNRKYLDFVFRLADSSSEYSNVIVVFLYDTVNSILLDDTNWKQTLSERFNSDSQYVNGQAIVGRINRVAIEDSNYVATNQDVSLLQFCSQINTRQLSARVQNMKDTALSRFQFNWFSALAILLPVGAIYAYRSRQSNVKLPQTVSDLPIVIPRDKSEDNTLKDIKIVASSSTSSLPSIVKSTNDMTAVATPPNAAFDADLFRSEYNNNIEGRSGSSYYGEGAVSSADKAAAKAHLFMSDDTYSVTSSTNSKHSHSGNGKKSSNSIKPSAIFNIAKNLNFGETSSVGSLRSPSDEVAAAHSALFSTRITTVPEDSLSPLEDSPVPTRDISKIHVNIDESIAPVRIRGRRRAPTTTQQQESPTLSRRQTRSQDMTTRSGTVIGSSSSGGGTRRGRAKSDQSRDNKKGLPPFSGDIN